MAAVSGLGYLGLNVRNLEAWRAFAENVLAMQCVDGRVGDRKDGTVRLRMDEQSFRFCLHESDADDVAYVGLEVADEGELEQLESQLRGLGIDCRRPGDARIRARGVADLLEFTGPAELPVEIYCGATVQFENPFQAPRPFQGFVTEGQGLGHIVLFVDDIQASLRVFREGLGFKMSDTIDLTDRGLPGRAYFLHCNKRHHTVALIQAPGVSKKLNHFMVQVESINDLGRALDAAVDNGVGIITTLGRHTNDQMVSFYMESPSGFGVEYGWGAITVDDATWTMRRHDSGSMWGHRSVGSAEG